MKEVSRILIGLIFLDLIVLMISLIGVVWNGYGYWFHMTMSSLIALPLMAIMLAINGAIREANEIGNRNRRRY